jgi:hypothetical protein
LEENLEIVISNDPIDIAGKSTGRDWTSCETIGGDWGWPPNCGWCDDIKANNLIAYIRKVGNKEQWLGRKMIRWCIRSDDHQPDVLAEKYYSSWENAKYRPIMEYTLSNILRDKGYSGKPGNVSCVTPYGYSGYLDSADSAKVRDHHIEYHLGGRGEEREEKIVYYPKLVEK